MLELRDMLSPYMEVRPHALDREPLIVRLAAKIDWYESDDECSPWMAALSKTGYGVFTVGGNSQLAHRVVYELLVGPIPLGLDLDHECHNRAVALGLCIGGPSCPHRRCVKHVIPATRRENILGGTSFAAVRARRTHCLHGHEFTPDNVYINEARPDGRRCRACHRQSAKEWRASH